jgi:hypothetical protein
MGKEAAGHDLLQPRRGARLAVDPKAALVEAAEEDGQARVAEARVIGAVVGERHRRTRPRLDLDPDPGVERGEELRLQSRRSRLDDEHGGHREEHNRGDEPSRDPPPAPRALRRPVRGGGRPRPGREAHGPRQRGPARRGLGVERGRLVLDERGMSRKRGRGEATSYDA